MLSSFTHPHVVLNLYEFLSYVEQHLDNIWKNAGNQTVNGPHWFHSIYFPTMEVNREQQLFFKIIQSILYCVQQIKNKPGLELNEGE